MLTFSSTLKNRIIRLGTRGSRLALAQSEWVKKQLETKFPEIAITLILVKTSGDKNTQVPLTHITTVGAFTKELDHALQNHTCDLVVHSLKDVPTNLRKNIYLAAIPSREDPSEAFCSKNGAKFREIPAGSVIGTSSLRRQILVKTFRRDLRVQNIRGNIDTRLRKLYDLDIYDGLILATAGLNRLQLKHHISEKFNPEEWPPAPGQGALAIAVRSDDEEMIQIASSIDDKSTRLTTSVERGVLQALGGGCQLPLGVFAKIHNELITVFATLFHPEGTEIIRVTLEGPVTDPISLANRVADKIRRQASQELKTLLETQKGKLNELP